MTDEEKQRIVEHYTRMSGGNPVGDFRNDAIEFKAIEPPKLEKQIDLVEYFERVKRHKADAWQIDFCGRLQDAFFNRHIKSTKSITHAEAQLGKSVILAQCYPAWILGHDPLHRIALATYNVTRSQAHSKAVIGILNLPVHRKIFRDKDSHVKPRTSVAKWQTPARQAEGTEAQDSFNPVGLQSGLTGSGFDTLIIDDPYADQKEAFSETTRVNLQEFWDFTVESRLSPHSNIFGMFHRYHVQDLAGYLLDKGTFEYWRYASIADGPYIHAETGQKFEDPLGREKGELISPIRRGLDYYADKRTNQRVFNSMFQGRPTSEEGGFFQINKIVKISKEEAEQRRREVSVICRAWDNAATDEGGDWSVGTKIGIRKDGRVTIFQSEMVQAATENRLDVQRRVAESDGYDVSIAVPQDPGSAGKDVVFFTKQHLKGYTVVVRPTSTNKQERARNFAYAVNSGQVEIVGDDGEEKPWNKQFLRALQEFPLSTFDDPVDSASDAYNQCFETFQRGLVIKNFDPARNLTSWSTFARHFGSKDGDKIIPAAKVPEAFTVYAGVKITPDASQPNSAVLVARAPEYAKMPDKLFVVAEYKKFTDDYLDLFKWLDAAINAYCAKRDSVTIWLHPDSEAYKHTIWQKLNRPVSVFTENEVAGLTELDWHLLPTENAVNTFNNHGTLDTKLFGLIADPKQMSVAQDEFGLIAFRQEAMTWHYDDKGKPSKVGAVLDCLRMVTYCFRTVSTPLTREQKIEANLAPQLQVETLASMPDGDEKDGLLQRRQMELSKAEKSSGNTEQGPHMSRFGRR